MSVRTHFSGGRRGGRGAAGGGCVLRTQTVFYDSIIARSSLVDWNTEETCHVTRNSYVCFTNKGRVGRRAPNALVGSLHVAHTAGMFVSLPVYAVRFALRLTKR